MPLSLPTAWRYGAPTELPRSAANAFNELVHTIAAQGATWSLLELFKRKFSPGSGISSSESWATSDLHSAMMSAAENAPTFIAAFWSGCEEIAVSYPEIGLPDASIVNQVLATHDVPYEVRPPHLVPRDSHLSIPVEPPERSLDQRAHDLIRHSLEEADRLLQEDRPRAAVQEVLWLLETVSTAFHGRESGAGTVEGKYFNEIVRDLRKHNRGTALSEILGWATKLHGFLSSPSGGGIRHGTELATNVTPTLAQARLYCNLTRSYTDYLLAELARNHSEGI